MSNLPPPKKNSTPNHYTKFSSYFESKDVLDSKISLKTKLRESSIELLRIIAMSMIVIHHILIHAIKPENFPGNLFYLFNPFVIIGVNLFFLISGYFQVKLSIKSILKLAFTVFFFGFINLILLYYFTGKIQPSQIIRLFLFPVSSSPYWFLSVYLILITISPIINFFLNNINKNKLTCFLIIFSFVIIYNCGLGYNYASHYGYSLLLGIYLYCLASFCRVYKDFYNQISNSKFLLIFLVSTVINSLCNYNFSGTSYFSQYTSIFVLISSFALFLLFIRIRIRSKIINSIATAALGCYLLQDGWFGIGFFYGYMNNIYMNAPNLGYIFGVFSAIFIGFWILSWILTKIERLWSVPLINFIERALPNKIKNLFQLSV